MDLPPLKRALSSSDHKVPLCESAPGKWASSGSVGDFPDTRFIDKYLAYGHNIGRWFFVFFLTSIVLIHQFKTDGLQRCLLTILPTELYSSSSGVYFPSPYTQAGPGTSSDQQDAQEVRLIWPDP